MIDFFFVPLVCTVCLPIVMVGEQSAWHVSTVATPNRPMLNVVFIPDLSQAQLLHRYLARHIQGKVKTDAELLL